MHVSQLTATGNVLSGTISPDGRHAAYVRYEPTGHSLWIQPLPTGNLSRLVAPEQVFYWSLSFAADGKSLYYVAEDVEQPVDGALYEVSVRGGTPRRLITPIASVRAAPDGRRLLYRRWQGSPRVSALVLANVDGSGERVLTVGSATRKLQDFAWSPDGETIAYAFSDRDAAGEYWSLMEAPLDGRLETTILATRRQRIGGLAWLPDRSGLIMNADDESLGIGQLWHVSYPDGATTRITHDLNSYGYPELTADGRTLLTLQGGRPSRIWIAPRDDPWRARPVVTGTGEYGDLAWTPDGGLVYVLARNLWVLDAGGGAPRQLTANARDNWMPHVTPDGRFIVFLSNRAGDIRLWRIDADGDNPVQLSDVEAASPQCSPDGRWVLILRSIDDRSTIWRVPIEGGTPVPWIEDEAHRPALSPDGRWLAYEYPDLSRTATHVAVRSTAGGTPLKTFDFDAGYGTIRFSPEGDGLVYIGNRNAEILLQPLAGGPPRTLVHSAFETLFAFALSPDGKQIAYTSGLLTSDAVLFQDLR